LGHIRLSQDEVAEVAVGDKVNIELNKYPTHSYGVLPGKIASISFVPYNKSYAVEVAFPEGLTTTNHKEIKYEIDLSGKAEIITSSRSILSRIFAPIYELFKEK
jgi:multidrug resistance efflux pump